MTKPTTRPTAVPHDLEAEELIIGGILAFPTFLPDMIDLLDGADFYSPAHSKLWTAVETLYRDGHDIETFAVGSEAGIDTQTVNDLKFNAPARPRAYTVELVLKHAKARRLIRAGLDLAAEAGTGNPDAALEMHLATIGSIDTPTSITDEAISMEELLSASEGDGSPWMIPGMMRQDWRAIIVAHEGSGKSTLLRQIGLCSSQGLHPMNFDPIMPLRVIIIDAENPVHAIAETGRTIHNQIVNQNGGFDNDALRVLVRPGGMNIRTRSDRAIIERVLTHHRPDLVIMGPVYKMFRRKEGESHEEATDPVLQILDDWRIRYGFALILEHHAPQGGAGHRELRPFGSQRWLAWPELGFGLRENREKSGMTIERFRGDRLINNWPQEIMRTRRPWPWQGRWDKPQNQPTLESQPF